MKTQCPNCKSKFNVNETNIGKQAKCPKCATPFTIEPFVETPASPVKQGGPAAVEQPVKSPEPVTPPAKVVPPAEPPASVAPPVKSPEPIAPAVKSPAPIVPPPISAKSTKQEQPEPKAASKTAVSKTLFLYCWTAVQAIAGVLGVLGLVLAIQKAAQATLIEVFATADVFLVCSVAIELMLFYKMWAAIKDSQPSISPGRAVGFLFIPVFNIYWALLMLTGFTEDYNSFIVRRSIRTGKLPMTLFLIYAVLFMSAAMFVTIPMICIFPFIGLISRAFEGYSLASWVLVSIAAAAGIGHFITYILVAFKTCDAINALPGKQT
ncbi:MAG: zinc-ribbon domain-containing protein [Sedimentisphaerales bacterium]|jgi:predicted Zn finger-like uncharacterized protein